MSADQNIPIATLLRGKDRMLRISIAIIGGQKNVDMALLHIDGRETGKGLAIELGTLPALLMALQMAGAAADDLGVGE